MASAKSKSIQLALAKIRVDGGTQPRAEIDELVVDDYAEDMKAGAEFPPVVAFYDGKAYWLADGFHRYQAAKRNRRKTILADVRQGTQRDAVLFSVGANAEHGLRRTNADKQRAVITLLSDEEWSAWSNCEIARRCRVSEGTVRNARTHAPDVATYRTKHGGVASMRIGGIGVTQKLDDAVRKRIRGTALAEDRDAIKALSRMSREEQLLAVDEVLAGRARTVDAALREARRQERADRVAASSTEDPSLPTGRCYPVLYADPPWQYDQDGSPERSLKNQYQTMTTEEICALEAGDLATDDAVLFLWTTTPMLEEALKVIAAWGFTFKSGLAWVKDKIGMGFWVRQRHEHLLVAVRGDMPPPAPKDRPDSVITAPRGRHSAKPERAYEIIEAMFPDAPKLELFARGRRKGWDAWGAEAPKEASG